MSDIFPFPYIVDNHGCLHYSNRTRLTMSMMMKKNCLTMKPLASTYSLPQEQMEEESL